MRGHLTASYRRWVRWYPRTWRLANEEALLGVLLDVAEAEGRNRLGAGERLSLAANGIAARAEALIPGAVRDRVASGAFALAAAFGALELFFAEWAPFATVRHAQFEDTMRVHWLAPGRELDFLGLASPFALVSALWIVAGVLAFLRARRSARLVMAAAGLVAIALVVLPTSGILVWAALDRLVPLFAVCVSTLAVLGTPRSRRGLAIGAGGWLIVLSYPFSATEGFFLVAWALPYQPVSQFFAQFATPQLISAAVTVALIVALGLDLGRRRTAAAAVVLSTLPWTALWVLGLGGYLLFGGMPELSDLTMLAGYLVTVTIVATRAALGGRAAARG